ncbi:MAG: 2Fe-2S iron-sulfur cluster binding domain-containing protein [Gammaproteobacteria bacterium]|nr:2Fe-2S iron-sulfur cluster binding domain-containing protein [Gammaproteobacteria bacterium]
MPERRTFSVRASEAILDAALHVGLNLPHSCKGGSCGACRARLLSGTCTILLARRSASRHRRSAKATRCCARHAPPAT